MRVVMFIAIPIFGATKIVLRYAGGLHAKPQFAQPFERPFDAAMRCDVTDR